MLGRSALWLCIGRDQSASKIPELIAASANRAGGRTKPDQLYFNLDVTEWVNGDPASTPRQALQKFELMLDNLTDRETGSMIRRMRADKEKQKAEAPASLFAANEKARSFLEESLGTDGFGKAFMTLGKKSLKVEGTVGDGLARFVLLRYIVSMSRMMEVQQERMKEMQERNKKTVEEATKAAKALQEAK